jgi:hypothetical protein
MFRLSNDKSNINKEAHMTNINTTGSTPKSIIKSLQTKPGLPFKELIPNELMMRALKDIEYRLNHRCQMLLLKLLPLKHQV